MQRTWLAFTICMTMAPLGCQADEFIPPTDPLVDARAVDAPRTQPVDAADGDAGLDDGGVVDALPDAAAVDASPPTYRHDIDIQPVWTANCASSHCHLSMQDAYDTIVDVPSSQVPSMRFIKPGSPDMSYLFRKLEGTHLAAGGMGESMPPGGSLKASTMEMIRVWIEEGAPR